MVATLSAAAPSSNDCSFSLPRITIPLEHRLTPSLSAHEHRECHRSSKGKIEGENNELSFSLRLNELEIFGSPDRHSLAHKRPAHP